MKKRPLILGALGLAAALALLAWAFAPRAVEVETADASVGAFETSIDEEARTRLNDRYTVQAPLAGRLARITLREGDAVKAGDVMATLTPVLSPLLDERTLAEQRARLGAAEAGRQRAVTRIDAARVALQQARNELRRTEQLAQQGFVAPTKVDADRLAAQAAQKELDTAVEGEHIAAHELQQVRAVLGVLRGPAAAGMFAVRAPVAGRVLKRHQTSEATVPAGAPLLDLGDTSRMEIVAELLTADALLARPGLPVRIERWGGPGTLHGRVARVEPAGFTKISALGVEEQRVNVVIEITSPAAEWAALGDGYRVAVRIVTRSEAKVLRVPVSAVFPLPAGTAGPASPAGAQGAFVVEAGKARLMPVVLGARNGSLAWVREGLADGTKVIVYPPAAVADGVRVRLRAP